MYRKFKIPSNSVSEVWNLHGFTFPFHCKIELSVQTFELKIAPTELYENFGKQSSATSNKRTVFTTKGLFCDTQHFKGLCSSCKEFSMDLLISMFTEEPVKINDSTTFYLRKFGQYPPYEIKPSNDVLSYLLEEDQDLYKKALMNLSTGYGIGAFAYFRRIIENEIYRIVENISNFQYEDSEQVRKAILKHKADHNISKLIHELNNFLPPTLKSLGNNPIKILWEKTSAGIHGLTEEECLQQATDIDKILTFTIKKIKEESSDIREVRAALSSLDRNKK